MPLHQLPLLSAALVLSISFSSCESGSDSYRDEAPKLVRLKETPKKKIIPTTTIPPEKTQKKKRKKSEQVPLAPEVPRFELTPIEPEPGFEPVVVKSPLPKVTIIDEENKIYDVVDIPAEFPGGIGKLREYMRDNLKYPVQADEMGITGKVYVGFIVLKDGSITDVVIKRGVDPLLDNEAKRFTKAMPKWTPGKIKDTAVNSRFILPIKFDLR
nr:energy transducer TonB [uncultured Fluviicola sp.]